MSNESTRGSHTHGTVTLHLHAAAREAAGQRTLTCAISTTDALRDFLVGEFGERMAHVLSMSTLLVDGMRVSPAETMQIPNGATVEVLPPFAGG
jgi:molybdopterin synthase sulfur carrier subunit